MQLSDFSKEVLEIYSEIADLEPSDYQYWCSQYDLDQEKEESRKIYACSWIENNVEILLFTSLYGKRCKLDLTEEEKKDFEETYPIFNEPFIADESCFDSLEHIVNFLASDEKEELLLMLQ